MYCEIFLQDMIENVLEIKDTYVREVMTPLVDVVAIDASATLVDFHSLWVTHQYSRCVELVIISSSKIFSYLTKPFSLRNILACPQGPCL